MPCMTGAPPAHEERRRPHLAAHHVCRHVLTRPARAAPTGAAVGRQATRARARQVKQDAIVGYAGRVELCAPTMDAREAGAARIQAATGAEYISPYNDARVMAGQGTMALELLEQARPLPARLSRAAVAAAAVVRECQAEGPGSYERNGVVCPVQ